MMNLFYTFQFHKYGIKLRPNQLIPSLGTFYLIIELTTFTNSLLQN